MPGRARAPAIPSFAVDVVKTRIQASEAYLPASVLFTADGEAVVAPREASPYRTIRSAAAHSYREEGWGVFVRGLGPTLLRSVPVNMVSALLGGHVWAWCWLVIPEVVLTREG